GAPPGAPRGRRRGAAGPPAARAAGVVAYGATGADQSGGHAARQAQALTAATFLDHTADVAYARPASSARYWKVRDKVTHTGVTSSPTVNYYYARSMDAVYVVADGHTYQKKGTFGWRLGPKELGSWRDLDRLPTDPAKLTTLMNSSKEYAGQSVFLQACALLGESPAGPELRAGLYRALARLHGVKLTGTVKDSTGRTGTQLAFNGVASQDLVVIDPKTSVVLEATSITTKGSARGEIDRTTYLSSGPADKIG
ncbi:hypothetical protein, partial [Streptomyces sp. NPDC058964]|uniref:hypothetical protein n=1 Tax=Streptomyces sp. NPDC058964 TaxID=3346681 RepID=UPI00368006F8